MDTQAREIAKMMGKSMGTSFQAHIVETCEETETCEATDKLTKSELTCPGESSYLDSETAKYARMLGESSAKAFQDRCATIISSETGEEEVQEADLEETKAVEAVVEETPQIVKKSRPKRMSEQAAPTPPTGSKADKTRTQNAKQSSPASRSSKRQAPAVTSSPVTRSSKQARAC